MFDLLTVLIYIGGFAFAMLIAFPLTAVGLWIYELVTGKDVLDEQDDFER